MNTSQTIRFILMIVLVVFFLFSGQLAATANVLQGGAGVLAIEGVASYYSYECANLPMANGKPFDPERRTCASWFYKFGTVLIIRSLDTGRTTEVVVTDRGPNKRLVEEGRIIDLSKRAFQDICKLEKGLTRVTIAVKN